MTLSISLAVFLPASAACDRDDDGGATAARIAEVEMLTTQGSDLEGTVMLREADDGVLLTGELRNLPPGTHGFHIHEGAACDAPSFESAGGHFAPEGNPHGAPGGERHHAGDLGNIQVDGSGTARIQKTSRDISLDPESEESVVGRTIVVHSKADDLRSQPSGDAGDRIACGVISLLPAER